MERTLAHVRPCSLGNSELGIPITASFLPFLRDSSATKNLGRVQNAQSSEHRGRYSEALAKPHRAERSAVLDLLRVSYYNIIRKAMTCGSGRSAGETQHRLTVRDRQTERGTAEERSPNLCQQERTFLTYSGYSVQRDLLAVLR